MWLGIYSVVPVHLRGKSTYLSKVLGIAAQLNNREMLPRMLGRHRPGLVEGEDLG